MDILSGINNIPTPLIVAMVVLGLTYYFLKKRTLEYQGD